MTIAVSPSSTTPLLPKQSLRLATDHAQIDIYHSLEECASFAHNWDQLVETLDVPIDLTYDWCRIWWKYYGRGRHPRIVVLRARGKLVGVLPMFIDDLRLGPVRIRVGRLVASDHGQPVLDLPVLSQWTSTALHAACNQLLRDDRCDAISFSPITGASPQLAAIRDLPNERTDLSPRIRDRIITSHALLHLPDLLDTWLATLSRNQRQNIRREWRRLQVERDARVDLIHHRAELDKAFDRFVDLHTKQWKQQRKLGHFGDWPRAASFHHDLAHAMLEHGRLRFLQVSSHDEVLEQQLAYAHGERLSCRLAARRTDPEFDRYSLSRTGLIRLLEHAMANGIRTIDIGGGRYDYKSRLGAVEHDVRSILLTRRGIAPQARARIFLGLAGLIDRAYYRTWHYRALPRLGGHRKPLWSTWIRSRI